MMATHHKASFWPHAVGDSLDPAIRKEDRVLTGNLVYIRRTIRVEYTAFTLNIKRNYLCWLSS